MLNVYEFDEKCLEDTLLKVLRFDSYSRDWAEFVLQNRRNRTRKQMHPYDIVIGPIANDAVGFQIRRYVSGLIDLEKFLTEMKYMGGIKMKYFFSTEKSLPSFKKIEVV